MSQRTIRNLIQNSFQNYSDNEALLSIDGEVYTYAKLYERALSISLKLKKYGVKKGDRVAILSESNPNWGISYLAVNILGAITVPILNDFSKKEIREILIHSEAKALFVSEKFLTKVDNDINTLDYVFDIGGIILNKELSAQKLIEDYNLDFADTSLNLVDEFGEIDENDLSSIIYTSGTTGSSKGVMLLNKNLYSNLEAAYEIQKVSPTDRFLSVLPMSHTYECTLGFLMPLRYGAKVYYLNAIPSPSILFPALKKVKPTIMLTVPLFIEKIYKNQIYPQLKEGKFRKLYKYTFVRKFLHRMAGKKLYKVLGGELVFFGIGGALLAPDVEAFLRDAKFPYAIGYGLTETSPLLAGTDPNNTVYRAAGNSVSTQQLKLININSDTGEGEIVAKGDNIMLGYYKNEELTKEVFTHDGWFKTGDLGYFDKNGILFIRGRLKNMILGPGGENIYPETIEAAVNRHKHVVESIVYEMDGRLVAKVHLNYENIEQQFQQMKNQLKNFHEDVQSYVKEVLDDVKRSVNEDVSKFSRLALVIEQSTPFEKTPTLKIKKYLYTEVVC